MGIAPPAPYNRRADSRRAAAQGTIRMGAIDANDCKPGTKLLFEGNLYNVIERAHHKPGKGGAFVKFKLKGLITGKVIDHTVRSGTMMQSAEVLSKNMQFLYKENDAFIFMDPDSYEQIPVTEEAVGFAQNFLVDNTDVQITTYEGRVIGLQLPPKMELTVVDTIDNAARGNTATNVTKDATLNTGLVIQVPMFVKTGDRVRVSTEDGSYVERA
jgi:elongation factor P